VKRLLVRALAEVGRYDEAEAAARRFAAAPAGGAEVAGVLGELLLARGRLAEAETVLARAAAGGGGDTLTARYNLGVLRAERGDAAGARSLFSGVAAAGGRAGLSAEQQTAVGGALQRLGRDDPARFRDALRAFDAAAAAAPLDPEPRVRAGELFLEKYNGADAGAAFAAVLRQNPRHPRALLGAARTRDFDGAPGADSLVRRSLAVNPRLAAAHVAVATARADAEDYAGARAAVAQALAVDSGSPAALAVLAAAHHLAGERAAAAQAERRALARNPRNAEVFVTLAEVSARHRLYEDAVAFAARGVALDPTAWRAHALRG
jgi:tetratricopeptide (TPR) repeat protein